LRTPISSVAKYSLRISIAPKKIIKAQWSSVGTVCSGQPYVYSVLANPTNFNDVRSLDEVLVPRVRSVQLLRVMDPHERIRFSVAKQSRDEAMRHVFDGRHLCVCVCVCRWVAKQSRDEAMRHVFDGRHLCGQTEHVWPDRACVANRACVSVCVGVWPNRAGMKQ